jgi:hypothetical protein
MLVDKFFGFDHGVIENSVFVSLPITVFSLAAWGGTHP